MKNDNFWKIPHYAADSREKIKISSLYLRYLSELSKFSPGFFMGCSIESCTKCQCQEK